MISIAKLFNSGFHKQHVLVGGILIQYVHTFHVPTYPCRNENFVLSGRTLTNS